MSFLSTPGSLPGALAFVLAAGCAPTEERGAAERSSFVTLPDGPTLHRVERGREDGEPVLLLHGYTDASSSFALLTPLLPADVRSIALDQRGHGRSTKNLEVRDLDDLAADAIGLLDALAIERATIVGHSMGSLVAQRIAIRHPARVRRLFLIASAARAANDVTSALIPEVDRLGAVADADFVAGFQRSTLHAPVPDDFFAQVCADSRRVPGAIWRQALAAQLQHDSRARLGAIVAPTWIVWGAHDAIFPRTEQDELARGIPGARLIVLPDVGHAPHWEQPTRIAELLSTFLREPVPASTSG